MQKQQLFFIGVVCALICFKEFKNMNCRLCKNIKASITFNNYNYCLSCFMSADNRTLLEEEPKTKVAKTSRPARVQHYERTKKPRENNGTAKSL